MIQLSNIVRTGCNKKQNARRKITEKRLSVQTFWKQRFRKTKEKMARCSVKTEQAKCLIHGEKKKKGK
jgi:hypothetical protein